MFRDHSAVMPGNWRKSSHSGQDGDCIEVSGSPDRVLVRDTKDRDGPALAFTASQWRLFTAALKR